MPYPENKLIRHRHRQIFTEPSKIEPAPSMIDGWLAGFIGRVTRIVRNIGARK
jgi:hypothetical protein